MSGGQPARVGQMFGVPTLVAVLTLLAGLSAGFFVTYEISVMRGLGRLDDQGFVLAMNAINDTVRNPWFAAIYFGTGLVAVVAAAMSLAGRLRRGASPPRTDVRSWLLLAGAAIYLVGVLAVTARYNLPLNQTLGRTRSGTAAEFLTARTGYAESWRNWNLVRVWASVLAFGCFVSAR